ncbi:MAG: NUDIX hydrolase [Prolixibacteraceae bacterium]|jgi:8-oxo-dGTP diphosphatase|nr:NUDIX hydrolase [Prolixibacteraceae bacterium]
MSYTYKYPRPSITTDAIVLAKEGSTHYLLLIKRGNDPFIGKWALPGGFIEMDEDLEEACYRELVEETNLTGISLTQFATFGKPGRDPRGRTISVVFWGIADKKSAITAGDDAAEARWFDFNALPPLAFDHDFILRKFKDEKSIALQ